MSPEAGEANPQDKKYNVGDLGRKGTEHAPVWVVQVPVSVFDVHGSPVFLPKRQSGEDGFMGRTIPNSH